MNNILLPESAPVAIERNLRKKPGPKPKRPIVEADFTPPEERVRTHNISLTDFLSMKPGDLKRRYTETLSITEALAESNRLRQVWIYTSEVLQQITQPKEQECYICHGPMPGNRPFGVQSVVIKNPDTNVDETWGICTIECLRQYNRKKMGMAAIPDRGEQARG